MRTMFTLAVVGILSSISFANADTPTAPTQPSNPSRESNLVCRFDGNHQQNNLRCEATFPICQIGDMSHGKCDDRNDNHKNRFELECNNGFELNTRDFDLRTEHDSLIVKAEEDDNEATIKIKDFESLQSLNDHEKFKASLSISNSFTTRINGFCKFEENHGGGLN